MAAHSGPPRIELIEAGLDKATVVDRLFVPGLGVKACARYIWK